MMNNENVFPQRYTPKQAARILGVSVDTLAVWRCTKRYPLSYLKIGRKVFYCADDLMNFIRQRTVSVDVN